ncbi:MAG: hypothetical protein ABIM89_10795 [Mycobacteriales bacterium]
MPAAPVIKVVVTHRSAARAKYGASGWSRIRKEVTALAKADNARGITTRFFALDSAADSQKVGATKVTAAADAVAVKASIDRIYAKWAPAYLMLLGGPELVPQHSLPNPLWTGDPEDDPDQFIRTDLPYACDAASFPSVTAFTGPTRAVGRLPDLVGETDADVLVDLLRHAREAAAFTSSASTPVFALSTKTWKVSTQLTVGKLAGVSGAVLTSPTRGPVWTAADLAPSLHLVNCHGGEFDPKWYGEATPGQVNLPTSMDAASLPGLIAKGSVVAAECCYGVAHWPPAAAGGQASVASTYLREGASGVFGASNVAYGPATANEYADLMCQYFLNEVLGGASLGRAALAARQRFVQTESFLDPTDLKTLGQFDLLGDPSIHPIAHAGQPVAPPTPPGPPPDGRVPHAPVRHSIRRSVQAVPAGVVSRRSMMTAIGKALESTAVVSNDAPNARAALSRERLAELLGYALPEGTRVRTYASTAPLGSERGTRRISRSVARRRLAREATPTGVVAHVAFVPATEGRGRALVVVRAEPGAEQEVRVVVVR